MRVVIADDNLLVREGIAALLGRRGSTSPRRPATRTSCWPRSSEHRPDVAIVDIRMPPTHTDEGLRAAQRSARAPPGDRRS